MTRRREIGPITELERQRAREAAIRLAEWHSIAGRWFPWREWLDPYRTTVTETLLQRTRAEAVASRIQDLIGRLPNWEALSRTPDSDLEDALRPFGLFRRRAKSLKAAAEMMVTEPSTPVASLPGVGQYIDRAVRVVCGGEHLAMVDANFVRVIHRVHGGRWRADYRYDRRLQDLAIEFISPIRPANVSNWAVLDFAALICKPRNPVCSECPINYLCAYFQLATIITTPTATTSTARARRSVARTRGDNCTTRPR